MAVKRGMTGSACSRDVLLQYQSVTPYPARNARRRLGTAVRFPGSPAPGITSTMDPALQPPGWSVHESRCDASVVRQPGKISRRRATAAGAGRDGGATSRHGRQFDRALDTTFKARTACDPCRASAADAFLISTRCTPSGRHFRPAHRRIPAAARTGTRRGNRLGFAPGYPSGLPDTDIQTPGC